MAQEGIDVEALYRRYGPMVLRRCRSLLNDEDQALDAMQDVFVQVLRRKDSLRADYPSSLLYRIATNTCLNAIRSRKRLYSWRLTCWKTSQDAMSPKAARSMPVSCEQLFEASKPGTRFIAETYYLQEATLAETARGVRPFGVRSEETAARPSCAKPGADGRMNARRCPLPHLK